MSIWGYECVWVRRDACGRVLHPGFHSSAAEVAPVAIDAIRSLMCVFVYAVCHYLHSHTHTKPLLGSPTQICTHTQTHILAYICINAFVFAVAVCLCRCKTHFDKMQTYVICMKLTDWQRGARKAGGGAVLVLGEWTAGNTILTGRQ